MSRLLETFTDLAFGVLNFFFGLSEATTRRRHDDPVTAEKKELTRLWLLSLAVAVITLLAALIVSSALGATSASGPLAFAAEALRRGGSAWSQPFCRWPSYAWRTSASASGVWNAPRQARAARVKTSISGMYAATAVFRLIELDALKPSLNAGICVRRSRLQDHAWEAL